MKNVRLLDCTLRDGGRIIDCAFPDEEAKEISSQLAVAGIDIVEVGFLRDHRKLDYKGNSTFFTDVDQIIPFINKDDNRQTIYAAFIDYDMFDFDSLKPYQSDSVDAIRFGFTKKNYDDNREHIINNCRIIKDRGYKLFIQGVNSLSYSDKELLEVIRDVNEIHPYSFGIVDTYGAMYIEDVDKIYSIIDHHLDDDICINFHSHNNYQLSFALAQEMIRLSSVGKRKIIIDGTLGGMGKVAGNLNLELIADYLVRRCGGYYDMDVLFDLIDQFIYKYSLKNKWGYSTASLMAGIYQSHPNNLIYLMDKFSLNSKDIGKILSMIEPDKRFIYDYNSIERRYIEYTSRKVDDSNSIIEIKKMICNDEVLVLVPGSSLNTNREEIDGYIEEKKPFVFSVNFVADYLKAAAFFGNEKRYIATKKKRQNRNVVITSNVKQDYVGSTVIVDYSSLIDRDYKYFENSAMMLLRLLRKIKISRLTLAGFDGFDLNKETNFSESSFQNDRYIDRFGKLNDEIRRMMIGYRRSVEGFCEISFITPSVFDEIVK